MAPCFPHPRDFVGRVEHVGDVRSQRDHLAHGDQHAAFALARGFPLEHGSCLVVRAYRGGVRSQYAYEVRGVEPGPVSALGIDRLRHRGRRRHPVVLPQFFFAAFELDRALIVIPLERDLDPRIQIDRCRDAVDPLRGVTHLIHRQHALRELNLNRGSRGELLVEVLLPVPVEILRADQPVHKQPENFQAYP